MEIVTKTDVIIVGAGPTGLSLACQLVRFGIDFIIIEKSPSVTMCSKAIGVQARTMEIYEQLGVIAQALDRGQIAGKIRILAGGKIRGGIDISTMGQGLSAYPYLFILEQSKNEQLLWEYLQSHHKDVQWQTELEHFAQDEMGVTAQVKTASGESETIISKYLVGCDGAKSPVRHALGLSFEGSTLDRMFYLVDAKVEWAFSHEAGYGCLSRASLGFFLPMAGENQYRIIGTFPENFEKQEGEILYTEIEQRIKEDTKLALDISNVSRFSVYKVNTRAVKQFSVGRCFVAGDAAHIHSPAGGQGMNTGIQDAYNLAWKMAFVIKGHASDKLLKTYNEERLPNAIKLLNGTDRAFSMMVGSNWFFGFVRMTILPLVAKYAMGREFVGKNIFSLVSQIRVNYRSASLSNHNGDRDFLVKAGDRMPYFQFEGASIYDKLRAPKFHLLVFTAGDPHDVSADWLQKDFQRKIKHKYGDLMDLNIIPLDPHVGEIFGTNRSFYVLLRPDNYIGSISTKISISEIEIYTCQILEHFLSPQLSHNNQSVQLPFYPKSEMPNSHKYRVLVCTKQRDSNNESCCFNCGGIEIYQAFLAEIKKRNLEDRVQICQSGCLDRCEMGAVVLVSQVKVYEPSWLPTKVQKRILSDKHWYTKLDIADVPKIVVSHFINGQPL